MNPNLIKISNFLNYISKILFTNGWGFIFTYLVFYLYSWHSFSKISILYNTFVVLHILNTLLFIYFVYTNKYQLKFKKIIFWLILTLIFLIPGAYLEYPSDPWSHFQRIFSFQNTEYISESLIKNKFSYFWGWTFMSNLEVTDRRFALDIYSAFWQLLLYYQFYLLSLKLDIDKYWSKVQIIGILFLFGTYTFTFRYYAISSTIVAQIAYIASIIALINIKKGKQKDFLILIPLLLIMYFNHLQEVMLFGISAVAILLDTCLNKNKKYTIVGLFILFILGYLWGYYCINYTELGQHRLWNVNDDFVSIFGSFKIWMPQLSYFQTFGIHGLIALIFAVIFFSKYQTVALLTLTPYLFLLFPPFVYLFSKSLSITSINWVTYRALFAFPTSFMFVVGLKEILNLLIKKIKMISFLQSQKALSIVIILIIILMPPSSPFRGRFWFQTYKVPAQLSLQDVDIVAQWLYDNRKLDDSCLIESDQVTGFVLETNFALKRRYPDRRILYNMSGEINTQQDLEKYIKKKNICRFLIAQHDKLFGIPTSKVALLSGHWDPNLVRHNMILSSEFELLVDSLQKKGWKKTFIPPFYWLYENEL